MRLIDKDQLLRELNTGMNIVEMIQTVIDAKEVEPKTGRWIDRGYMKVGYHCSECGGYSIAGKDNYCPNCGAKMEVEHEVG